MHKHLELDGRYCAPTDLGALIIIVALAFAVIALGELVGVLLTGIIMVAIGVAVGPLLLPARLAVGRKDSFSSG